LRWSGGLTSFQLFQSHSIPLADDDGAPDIITGILKLLKQTAEQVGKEPLAGAQKRSTSKHSLSSSYSNRLRMEKKRRCRNMKEVMF
jgi:hypothetical protein